MKIGDKVKRLWKPLLGTGTIIHVLGDKIVVKWSENREIPTIEIEQVKHLKIINESR